MAKTITDVSSSKALFGLQRRLIIDMNDAFVPLVGRLQQHIARATGSNGQIIPQQIDHLVSTSGDEVQRFFVGRDYRHPFAADGVTALAVYPDILNRYLVETTYIASVPHSKQMRAAVPSDVQEWLTSRQRRELAFLELDPAILLEKKRSPFIPNPLAEYEAPHTWVDPNGYRLSDRIWRTSVKTRADIDNFLTNQIANGNSAANIAKQLEQFLLPSRAALRTNAPYGTDASYDAMRLARTEISRAHAQASYAAGQANPFVTGYDWALSGRHPKYDICDGLATIAANGKRLRAPYPKDNTKIPVVDSHPQCLCTLRPSVTASSDDVVAAIRAQMGKGDLPPLTPIEPRNWVRLLLGNGLSGILGKLTVSPLT